jgi:hypothetical protein
MAGLYMTFLTNNGGPASFEKQYPVVEMAKAMHKTVKTIIDLQIQHFGPAKRPNSLNLCATDGDRLVAYRFRNHAKSQPPSLYYSTKVSGTQSHRSLYDPTYLRYLYRPERRLTASIPTIPTTKTGHREHPASPKTPTESISSSPASRVHTRRAIGS